MLIRQSQGDYNIIDNVIYYIIVPLAEPRQRRLLARFAGQENGPRRTSADTVGQSCCSLLRCLVSCFFDYLKPALEFQHSRRSRSVILLCDCWFSVLLTPHVRILSFESARWSSTKCTCCSDSWSAAWWFLQERPPSGRYKHARHSKPYIKLDTLGRNFLLLQFWHDKRTHRIFWEEEIRRSYSRTRPCGKTTTRPSWWITRPHKLSLKHLPSWLFFLGHRRKIKALRRSPCKL